jgi:hypothetical protein
MSDDEAMHVRMFLTLLVKNLLNDPLIHHALHYAILSRRQAVMNLLGWMMMFPKIGQLVTI